MKTGIFSLGALALCQLAAAQPHMPLKHLHLHHARDQLAAREIVTVTKPAVKVQEVVVYVDANGKEVSRVSKLVDAPAATPVVAKAATTPKAKVVAAPAAPASVPVPAPVAAPAPVAKVAQVEKKPVPQPKPAPAPSSVAAPEPSPSTEPSSPSSGPGFGHGISYAPYKQTATGGCKTADEISKDLSVMKPFGLVRIYGTDCEQVENVLTAVQGKNIQVFAGIYNINNWQAEADIIIAAAKSNWDAIHTISVGNEVVNGGGSVSAVTGALNAARTYLRNAGYQGPVVTVDTMMALDGNPELWQNSDYVAMNCHAFFDGNVAAEGAGDFVAKWVQKFQGKAGGKDVVVTESGWPHGGYPHGAAIPGSSQQASATASLKAALPSNLILYSAFNNMWLKDNEYTYGAEHFWGMLNGGVAPSG